MAIACPRCRMEVAPDAAFCDQCGAPLDLPCPGCQHPRRFSPERAHSPLVGREAELAALLDLYAEVRRGATRVAIVAGEAGVGKSRLLFEFRRRIADSEPRWLEGHCVAYARTVPYRPIVDVLRVVFALRDSDPPPPIWPTGPPPP